MLRVGAWVDVVPDDAHRHSFQAVLHTAEVVCLTVYTNLGQADSLQRPCKPLQVLSGTGHGDSRAWHLSCPTLSCAACLQALSNQLKEQGIEMVLPAMADSRLLVMLRQALEDAGVPCAAPNSAILANAQHKAR